MFLLFGFCCGTPPSCLKVMVGGGWVVVVAYRILVSAQVPFGFIIGVGTGLDCVGVGPRGFED